MTFVALAACVSVTSSIAIQTIAAGPSTNIDTLHSPHTGETTHFKSIFEANLNVVDLSRVTARADDVVAADDTVDEV